MRVYIAGAISKGNPTLHANIRNAILAGDAVFRAGHTPFIPHLDFLWELVSPCSYEERMSYDHEWIKVCEALIRLPGDSPGADREVEWARQQGIPVYFGVESFLEVVGRSTEEVL